MHMLVVKYNLFNSLKVPFSSRQFGQNKTWRGLLFVGLANGLFSLLLTYFLPWEIKNPFLLGMVLGIAYILFELPNSYLKRRIGIGPGEESKDNKLLHGLLDKLDSSFGVSLVYFLLGYGSFFVGVCLFFYRCIGAHSHFFYISEY